MTDTANDQATSPAALPGDGLREGVVDELRRRLGDAVVDVELRPQDDLWVRVTNEAWASAGEALRSMGFSYFCFLSGLDWLPSPYGRSEDNPDEPAPERSTEIVPGVTGGDTRFQVFARVVDPVRHVGVTLKADVADDAPVIASWHTIWAGANWHEREAHEMFGISFAGHPDLRNMYLPGDFEGHPLRKDFPLLSRMIKPWPGIVDVEPMPAEEEEPSAEAPAGEASAPEAPVVDTTGTQTGGGEPAATDEAEPVADATSAEPVPDEDEPASAPETAADTAGVTDRTAENAPDQEPAPEPASAATSEDEPVMPTAPDATVTPTAEEPDAGPVDAPADTVVETTEPRPDAEAEGATPPTPDVESAPEEGTDVVAPAAAEGTWSPDIPVADVEGPYGVGSKDPRPDGSAPPDHPIKATTATMRFHVPGSEGYDDMTPDVWFDSETTARAAGFVSPFEEDAS